MVFSVSLNEPSATTVTVAWATRAGTAAPGSDFVAASGTVTFDPGDVNEPVLINIVGDTTVEDAEEFFVDLSGAVGATISDGEGRGRIVDDDSDGRDE